MRPQPAEVVVSIPLLVVALCSAVCVCSAQRLLISEYVHGTSTARAIEIFNPSCFSLSMTNYAIRTAVNGWVCPALPCPALPCLCLCCCCCAAPLPLW
jgi:hypothetical protein